MSYLLIYYLWSWFAIAGKPVRGRTGIEIPLFSGDRCFPSLIQESMRLNIQQNKEMQEKFVIWYLKISIKVQGSRPGHGLLEDRGLRLEANMVRFALPQT
jgi:hypothetical protein